MTEHAVTTARPALALRHPLLPTGGVGSYSVPEWLERVNTDYFQRRISSETLRAIQDVAIKAAIKDQELAGLDIVTDGELRRDNLVDHFAVRLAGVEIDRRQKAYYYDYYDSVVRHRLPLAPLHLEEEFLFAKGLTDRVVKFSLTGPHTLVKRIRDEYYHDQRAFAADLARVFNAELKRLAAAGAPLLQIDEPYLGGFPEDLDWVVDVLNAMVEGVEAQIALHVCYGNRYGKPSWEGSYHFLFPRILDARIDVLLLEFARKGTGDLALFRQYPAPFRLGMGVIDVKDTRVETPQEVAALIRRGLEVVPPERLWLNPDCGLRHLPPAVAQAKLAALAQGAALVRAELLGTPA
jgi:5-methyltetrahydropteroyltriglutamate--homocysteine methyltransferase